MRSSGTKWCEVGNRGESSPRSTASAHPPSAGAREQRESDWCSPASTGTRWTTRDASPSLRSSARSSLRARSSRAGWTNASRSTPAPGGRPWPTRSPSCPSPIRRSRLFQRFIFAGAFEAEVDRQGRILVPAYLREAAGLEGDAVVVGSRDHAEIWAPNRWDRLPPRARQPPVAGQGPRRARDLADGAPHALPGSARDPTNGGGGEMKEGHLPVLAEEVLAMLAATPRKPPDRCHGRRRWAHRADPGGDQP